MTKAQNGAIDIGNGLGAFLQAEGSWGYSNAGLVWDSGEALLVDTLFDRELTARMLSEFRRLAPVDEIGTVVNTHANGDHCWGNGLLPNAEIVATKAAAEEMSQVSPAGMRAFLESFDADDPVARYLDAVFGSFDFDDNEVRLPTRCFDGSLTLDVGTKRVELHSVGPAHTLGDLIVYVRDSGTLFTGDIVFVDSHPIVWAGPVSGWIAACDEILSLDVDLIVPGHGPLAGRRHVEMMREYLCYVEREAFVRHEAGMTIREAARDISLSRFERWGEAERIVANVAAVYRELEGGDQTADYTGLTREMACLAEELGLYGLAALAANPKCGGPQA